MKSATTDEIEQSRTVFNKISAFDFGKVLAKHIEDYSVSPDTANEILVELKRWLTLCVLHPENAYATGGKVDEMWHTFILFTKDYARFCHDIAGAFIHHAPETGSDDIDEQKRSAEKMLEKATLLEADYVKYFGVLPPGHIWPKPRNSNTLENAFRFLEAMSRGQLQV